MLILGIFVYKSQQNQKLVELENQSDFVVNSLSTNSQMAAVSDTDTDEPFCDNYEDVQDFEKPIPVIWVAKFDGCLMSCYGASFTRVPIDAKYPRFAGYYPDVNGKYNWEKNKSGNYAGGQIPDIFLKEKVLLKIYGKWSGIEADHPFTVFGGKCVPFVEIERIEIAK